MPLEKCFLCFRLRFATENIINELHFRELPSYFYRPRDAAVAKKYDGEFPKLKLFTIDDVFGGWTKAQKEHFSNGGTFDQISQR